MRGLARFLSRLRHGWIRLGLLLGRITSPILLGALYFLLVWPTGLLARPSLRARSFGPIDAGRATYRVPSAPLQPHDMEKPF